MYSPCCPLAPLCLSPPSPRARGGTRWSCALPGPFCARLYPIPAPRSLHWGGSIGASYPLASLVAIAAKEDQSLAQHNGIHRGCMQRQLGLWWTGQGTGRTVTTVTWVVCRTFTLGQRGPRDSIESSHMDFSSSQKGHNLLPLTVKESGAGTLGVGSRLVGETHRHHYIKLVRPLTL